MGVGAGLYMYVVVVQKFTFAISSPDEFLFIICSWLSDFILTYLFSSYPPFMALNGLWCADVPLRNYSLTHSLTPQTRQRITAVSIRPKFTIFSVLCSCDPKIGPQATSIGKVGRIASKM